MFTNSNQRTGTSILLLIVYGCYLFFQLKTHTAIYNAPSPKVEKITKHVSEGDASRGMAQIGKMAASVGGRNAPQMPITATEVEAEDEEEQPQLSVLVAVLTLVIATVLIALCSEFMVSSDRQMDRRFSSLVLYNRVLLTLDIL